MVNKENIMLQAKKITVYDPTDSYNRYKVHISLKLQLELGVVISNYHTCSLNLAYSSFHKLNKYFFRVKNNLFMNLQIFAKQLTYNCKTK